MSFSILRVLILTAIFAAWLGLATALYRMEVPPTSPNNPILPAIAAMAFSGLVVGGSIYALSEAWAWTGRIEEKLKKPPLPESATHE